ncbi:hypothetical protein [Leptospirillum ferriphilum]|uniref:hypothetical protein n=1 Tax=Leptospirillum ferriphilum TaxID=178606 RepID=UPI0015C2CD3F|nr:hypothetical protein [Leptospirillum ferriphilum]
MVRECAQCGEILIREELEDPEFLEEGRSEFGGPVCYECSLEPVKSLGEKE